jgi:hypothetical protein
MYRVESGDVVQLPPLVDVQVPVGWSGSYEEWPQPDMSEEPILFLEEEQSGDTIRVYWLRSQSDVSIAVSSLEVPPSRVATRTPVTESLARSLDAFVVAGTSSHSDDTGVTWIVVDAGKQGLEIILSRSSEDPLGHFDNHLGIVRDMFERRQE